MLRKFGRLVLSWLFIYLLNATSLLRSSQNAAARPEPSRYHRTDTRPASRPDEKGVLPPELRGLVLSWMLLLLLGAAEFAASYLPLNRSLRPFVMIPGVLMVAVVAIRFMEVGKGPTIVRGFAVAAIFWLIVLLGLGSADPLTRIDYYVPNVRVQ